MHLTGWWVNSSLPISLSPLLLPSWPLQAHAQPTIPLRASRVTGDHTQLCRQPCWERTWCCTQQGRSSARTPSWCWRQPSPWASPTWTSVTMRSTRRTASACTSAPWMLGCQPSRPPASTLVSFHAQTNVTTGQQHKLRNEVLQLHWACSLVPAPRLPCNGWKAYGTAQEDRPGSCCCLAGFQREGSWWQDKPCCPACS